MAEFITRKGTRIEHPATTSVHEEMVGAARRAVRRGTGGLETAAPGSTEADLDALLEGLALGDVDVQEVVQIAPETPRDVSVRRRTGLEAGPEPTIVSVAVDPGERAAILVEIDGVYEWVLPDYGDGDRPAVRRGEAAGRATFRIGGRQAGAPGRRGPGLEARRRGGLFGAVVGALVDKARVVVVKFAAEKLVNVARNRLEDGIRPGLIAMTGDDPSDWVVREFPAVAWPADGPGRVLLFIHGTFSSTLGSFGVLTATPDGKDLLAFGRDEYDAMLAYDHSTLADTPEENARAILADLMRLAPPAGTTIDIVAYSRGGLVARLLIERLLGEADWPLIPEKAVFIACTSGGTALADRQNWKVLLDLYTNLIVAAGHGLSFLDAGTASTILTESVKTLTGFVQAVVDAAIVEDMVPGIAAMAPTSDLVARLNGPGATPDAKPVTYFAFGSDFEPSLFDTSTDPLKKLPARLIGALADLAADQLMKESNDLVVDTEAMTQFGGYDERLVHSIILERNEAVYHTIYFAQPHVATAVWSALAGFNMSMAAPSDLFVPAPKMSDSAPPARPVDELVSARRRSPDPGLATGFESIGRDAVDEASPPQGGAEEFDAGEATEATEATCHFGAEMPENAPLEEEVELTVTVSREQIELAAGAAAATGEAIVRLKEPIQLEVRARANCDVVWPASARVEVRVPDPEKPELYDFRVKGRHAGPAEIWVDARQGARRLTRLVLQPVFVALNRQISAGAVAATTKPEKANVQLRIIEESSTEDHLRLRFLLQSRDLDLGQWTEVQQVSKNKNAVISDFFDRMEGEWGRNIKEFDTFMDQIRSYGAFLYTELVPETIRSKLWDHRDAIGCIEVTSQEPSIPWEILHTVDRNNRFTDECAFLGELGLVRWVDNFYWPPASLSVRDGAAHYVIPDYADPGLKLRGAAEEAAILEAGFGAQPVTATRHAVLELLQAGNQVDLLHFACHGAATSDNIWNAALLMQGNKRPDGSFNEERLEINDIKFRAALRHDDGAMPLVFINACQAGATGRTLTGTGGLAETFIRCGAGLFVSTLWSIGDDTAHTFAKTFYDSLLKGETVSESARAARQAAKTAKEPTWLAYSVYGHPYARLRKTDS